MIKTEEDMYSVLMKLSKNLGLLEGSLEEIGLEYPAEIQQAWREITEWLEER